jgi:hypothetical protein
MFELVRDKLISIQNSALDLSEKYADTTMMGRTHNIHALPITFGYKAAIWADELERCIQRLDHSRDRILVLQMSGAVGSMVSFGNDGPAIQQKMAEDLGVNVPGICWHASRDRLAEFTCEMALIGGCLGRIAQEIYLLMGTELGELSEPFAKGTVGSSTMPHKVNPTSSQHMMSLARDIRYHNAAVLEMMLVDHERDIMHFVGERQHIEACCIAVACLYENVTFLVFFSIAAIIFALYIMPNKQIVAITLSILFLLVFYVFFIKKVEGIGLYQIIIGLYQIIQIIGYNTISIIICNISLYVTNYYKRKQYADSKELARVSVMGILLGTAFCKT